MANEITPALLDLIRADLKAALEAAGQKHGVKLQFGRGSYTETNATLKLEVSAIADGGTVVTREMADLKRYAKSYGLTEAHLTQAFIVGRERFILVDYRNKASARPWSAKNLRDGKNYILTTDQVIKGLGIETPKLVITQIPHIPTR